MSMQRRDEILVKIKKDLQRQIFPDLLQRMALAGRAAVLRYAPPGLDVAIVVGETKSSAVSSGKGTADEVKGYSDAYEKVADLWKTRQEFNKSMALFGVV
jgi:hypothetical protein